MRKAVPWRMPTLTITVRTNMDTAMVLVRMYMVRLTRSGF